MKKWGITVVLGLVFTTLLIYYFATPLLAAGTSCGRGCAFCACNHPQAISPCWCSAGEGSYWFYCGCACYCPGEGGTIWECSSGEDWCEKGGGGDPWDPWDPGWPPYMI